MLAGPAARAAGQSERQHWAGQAIAFVRSIGLLVQEATAEVLTGSFVPGVRIAAGGLVVDPENVFPGDVLHEAGHLATIPAVFRPEASGTLGAVSRRMQQHLADHPEGLASWPEDRLCRGILQCGDSEATAWQYAAAQHIGLPDTWLFPPGSFDGNAEETLMRLKWGRDMGINGLQAAGWTKVHAFGNPALPLYPQLAFWLHP
jgi:hypothetical protein